MRIQTIPISKDHWSTEWIPISYETQLTQNQLQKSRAFLWHENQEEVLAICRAIYINKNNVELSDLWLNPDLRGKTRNGNKISTLFLKKVIGKIWISFPSAQKLTLLVAKDNVPARKLYEKLGFQHLQHVPRRGKKLFPRMDLIFMKREKRQRS